MENLYFFFSIAFLFDPSSFTCTVLLLSAAFIFSLKGRHKNVMCILDKEICDVGTFFALRVLAFFVSWG